MEVGDPDRAGKVCLVLYHRVLEISVGPELGIVTDTVAGPVVAARYGCPSTSAQRLRLSARESAYPAGAGRPFP